MVDFKQWMRQIDEIVQETIGVSVNDLDDWTYGAAFNDGVPAKDAAFEVMHNDDMARVMLRHLKEDKYAAPEWMRPDEPLPVYLKGNITSDGWNLEQIWAAMRTAGLTKRKGKFDGNYTVTDCSYVTDGKVLIKRNRATHHARADKARLTDKYRSVSINNTACERIFETCYPKQVLSLTAILQQPTREQRRADHMWTCHIDGPGIKMDCDVERLRYVIGLFSPEERRNLRLYSTGDHTQPIAIGKDLAGLIMPLRLNR